LTDNHEENIKIMLSLMRNEPVVDTSIADWLNQHLKPLSTSLIHLIESYCILY